MKRSPKKRKKKKSLRRISSVFCTKNGSGYKSQGGQLPSYFPRLCVWVKFDTYGLRSKKAQIRTILWKVS